MIWLVVIVAARGVAAVVVHVTADEQISDQLVRVDDPPATETPAIALDRTVEYPDAFPSVIRADADSEDYWAAIDALRSAAGRDLWTSDMEQLVADRAACRRLLALVSTFPQAPACRQVEDLLLDEHKRLETEIARRQLAGLAHPRYLDQKAG